MPSEATLRKLIRDEPGFVERAVVSIGKNGVAYEIDVEAAVTWLQGHEEEKRAAARARSEEVRQFALELLGPGSSAENGESGLSAAERRALLEEEIVAIKLAEKRGELVRKDSVEAALSTVIVKDAQRRSSFSARLAKRIDLPRDIAAAIDALQDHDRRQFAGELEKLSETAHADAAPGAGPAV